MMKISTTIKSVILCLCGAGFSLFTTAQVRVKQLEELLDRKAYFELESTLKNSKLDITEEQRLEFMATLDQVFNRLEASNEKIDELQKKYGKKLNDTVQYRLLEMKQVNYAKLYNYEKAAATIRQLLDQYEGLLSDDEKKDFENTYQIWSKLRNVPKQKIVQNTDVTIPLVKDKAGLSNLQMVRDTTSIGCIFDTGANISTITETTALRMRMNIVEAKIEVRAITGLMVMSKLAWCPSFKMGDILVENAIFLVFPDSALAIPQINYQINGIIGFPVIEALKEVHISKDNLFIPVAKSKAMSTNMALDFLTPIVSIKGDAYRFDTGATSTMLYKPYYDKFQKELDPNMKLQDISFGGAGGSITRKGYAFAWKTEFNGQPITCPKAELYTDELEGQNEKFFGNIGQDFIRQYPTLVLNFDSMFISLQ